MSFSYYLQIEFPYGNINGIILDEKHQIHISIHQEKKSWLGKCFFTQINYTLSNSALFVSCFLDKSNIWRYTLRRKVCLWMIRCQYWPKWQIRDFFMLQKFHVLQYLKLVIFLSKCNSCQNISGIFWLFMKQCLLGQYFGASVQNTTIFLFIFYMKTVPVEH